MGRALLVSHPKCPASRRGQLCTQSTNCYIDSLLRQYLARAGLHGRSGLKTFRLSVFPLELRSPYSHHSSPLPAAMLTIPMRFSAPTSPPFAPLPRAALAALLLAATLPAHADDRFTQFGDALQIALPLAALTCAANQGRAGETALGFAVQAAAVNGSKAALGDARINQRPDGTGRGFPSGHSASAMFGAANLAKFCYQGRPALQFVSYSLALTVGLSRVDADRHTPLQVAAGLAFGYFANGLRFAPSDQGLSLSYTWNF